MKYKLSTEGIAVIMMVLQKGILEGTDMTDTFKELEWFINVDNELVCDNPPIIDYSMLDDQIQEQEE